MRCGAQDDSGRFVGSADGVGGCSAMPTRYKSQTLSLDLSPGSYFWGKST